MAVTRAISLTGQQMTLSGSSIAALRSNFGGHIALEGDPGYDEGRLGWNGMFDKRPAVVARCTGADDVIQALAFAREHGLLVAVRGGGHSVAGHSSCDGGMVIDLSLMNRVQVDQERRVARVAAGATWGVVDQATQPYALVAPGGVVSTTGVAGLTLGGGYGWLRRKYGLSCDNLLAARVVTVGGEQLVASAEEHADLFWALRGGGGNFAIVTEFEFQLHPVGPDVMYATVFYPFERGAEVIRAWSDFMETISDEVTSDVTPWTIPSDPEFPEELHGRDIIMLEAVYAGPPEVGRRVMQPLRHLAEPLLDFSAITPYLAAQSAVDALLPPRQYQYYWKSLNLERLSNSAIETIMSNCRARPSKTTLVPIRYLGGAFATVPAQETAFGDRSSPVLLSIDATWSDPADSAANIAWARSFWQQMQPYSTGGAYLNFAGMDETDGDTLVRASYGKNFDRLAKLKHRYDPENVLRLNHNITPSQ